jgi:Bacterial protein of unknown function (DUF903)
MKRFFSVLFALALCAGCSTHYNIKLTNGEVITSRGKPKLDKDKNGYFFTDASGNPDYISLGRVEEIEPQSWKKKYDEKSFNYLPAQGSQ